MGLYKMAVIGEEDLIRGFGLVGLELFYAKDANDARRMLQELKDQPDYGIIFITESIAQSFLADVEAWGNRPLPSIVFIPGVSGNEGFAMERIRRIVERAVGADILKGKEVGNA